MMWIKQARKASVTVLATLTCVALASGRSVMAAEDERVDPLVGVWESVAPAQVDCETGQPLADAPIIRAAYTVQHGGTMTEENTDPIEGPYRSSGVGIWRRTAGRSYAASYQHYGFVDENLLPTKQLGTVVKARTSIRLSADGKTFVESGTFAVFLPDPATSEVGEPVFTGCFASMSRRLTF
jgi:hypothetical protein